MRALCYYLSKKTFADTIKYCSSLFSCLTDLFHRLTLLATLSTTLHTLHTHIVKVTF